MSQASAASVAAPPSDASALTLRMGLAERIGEGALELPLLPRVAGEVMTLTMQDEVDAARLSALIQQDPALASHVLRVVNSPAYGGAAKVVSLQQAVARLGLSAMREIAVTISMQAVVMDDDPDMQQAIGRLWRQSLCTGLWAKELARSIRDNVEVAYLCGLLRDVGMPVLLRAADPDLIKAMGASNALQAVEPLAGQAGAELTRSWHLPEAVVASQVYRDRPRRAGDHSKAALVAAAAGTFAVACMDDSLDVDVLAADPAVTELNLYPEDVEALVAKADTMRNAADGLVAAG